MSIVCPVCGNEVEDNESACPTCGFKLAGSTQQFQPVVLPDENIVEDVKPVQEATLRILRGPQTGIAFQLGDETLTIGRSPQCGIFLNDMTVSRKHALLKPESDGYVISDTNSFNGVWVNNDSIDEYHLKSGDIIQIGVFLLLYQES